MSCCTEPKKWISRRHNKNITLCTICAMVLADQQIALHLFFEVINCNKRQDGEDPKRKVCNLAGQN